MELGIIGLGKMGYPLALNSKDRGVNVFVYSENEEKLRQAQEDGIKGFHQIDDFVQSLKQPRVIWLMIPAGDPVDQMIAKLTPYLSPEDVIIDGGNSQYRDSIARYEALKGKGIHFLDVGTSGGVSGARNGACLMIGGDAEVYKRLEPIFLAISNGKGCGRMGASGAGHYVKMIHNGIEYGMMQAIGEGLSILRESEFDFELDQVAQVWQSGSIITGLLMDVTADALKKDGTLSAIEGIVNVSGEAEWTVEEAVRLKVAAPVISASLFARFKSLDKEKFSEKSLAAMRNEFGGHKVIKRGGE